MKHTLFHNPLRALFAVRRLATPAFAASGYAGSALLDENDLIEQLQQAERADWLLLRLVVCAALATLLLAAALNVLH